MTRTLDRLTPLPLLQRVQVASPCDAVWENMDVVDGERVHHCHACRKNVYNLSAMSQVEAETLLREHEGRLCVRYFQRTDGTILSGDCPVGASQVRREMMRRSRMAATLFGLLFCATAAVQQAGQHTTDSPNRVVGAPTSVPQPVSSTPIVGGKPVAPVKHMPDHEVIMGAPMAVPHKRAEIAEGTIMHTMGMVGIMQYHHGVWGSPEKDWEKHHHPEIDDPDMPRPPIVGTMAASAGHKQK